MADGVAAAPQASQAAPILAEVSSAGAGSSSSCTAISSVNSLHSYVSQFTDPFVNAVGTSRNYLLSFGVKEKIAGIAPEFVSSAYATVAPYASLVAAGASGAYLTDGIKKSIQAVQNREVKKLVNLDQAIGLATGAAAVVLSNSQKTDAYALSSLALGAAFSSQGTKYSRFAGVIPAVVFAFDSLKPVVSYGAGFVSGAYLADGIRESLKTRDIKQLINPAAASITSGLAAALLADSNAVVAHTIAAFLAGALVSRLTEGPRVKLVEKTA